MDTSAPKIVASIEARMSASRLPGKVLMDVAGKPALERLVTRLRAAETVEDIVVATTTNPADDAIEDWANQTGVAVYRGSEDDVLDRVVEAHAMMQSDIIVEICGDTPLLDPAVVDQGVRRFLKGDADVVCNVQTLTWPQGIDVQVFAATALATVRDEITDPAVREHVSLYFYENPETYRIVELAAPIDQVRPGLRLQMDYAEDLDLIREVYRHLEPELGPVFGVPAILSLMDREPHLAAINAHCEEKAVR